MTAGASAVNLANKWLSVISGTTFTGVTSAWAKLHTADPGSAGATAAAVETTRKQWAFAAPSAGAMAAQATFPSWLWATGPETITHVSVWDASTAGNFLYSYALTASKSPVNGDTLTLNSHSVTLTPIAA